MRDAGLAALDAGAAALSQSDFLGALGRVAPSVSRADAEAYARRPTSGLRTRGRAVWTELHYASVLLSITLPQAQSRARAIDALPSSVVQEKRRIISTHRKRASAASLTQAIRQSSSVFS